VSYFLTLFYSESPYFPQNTLLAIADMEGDSKVVGGVVIFHGQTLANNLEILPKFQP
jgi:hypothetical protein